MDEFDNMVYLELLYRTLRAKRPRYSCHNFFWKLGTNVISELELKMRPLYYMENESKIDLSDENHRLFGIRVETDYNNPDNIQLFEDITREL